MSDDLVGLLRRTAENDRKFLMFGQHRMLKAAKRIEEDAALIQGMREAFQAIGNFMVSEAAVSSRSGQMDRLEAFADLAFLYARKKAKSQQEGETE